MKLSLIVCVYNTDKRYLQEALGSIAASTLKDYEICLVDDGSDVDYSDIAAAFGARLYKKENGGILSARLSGIEMAQGDYLAFFDSDDTVSIHYHQPMLDEAERTGADIVMNDWAFHTEKSRYFCRTDSSIANNLSVEGDEVFTRFFSQEGREQSYYVTWNKIYRSSLLKYARERILRSPIGERRISFGEDVLFNFYAFEKAKKLSNLHTGYYFYRMHANQSVNVIGEERLASQIGAMGRVFDMMEQEISAKKDSATLLRHLNEWRTLMARTHYSHALGGKFTGLYPKIGEVYGVKKLKKAIWRDSAVYYKVSLLGNNFVEIDAALRPLFDMSGTVELLYDKRDPYVTRILSDLSNRGVDVRYQKEAKRSVPKRVIRTKDKILHNDVVYAVGVLLFKKGSKLRALLKRIL